MKPPAPDFSWERISDEGLAAFEDSLGRGTTRVGDVFWRQVRPGFFRPLVTMREYPADLTALPRFAQLGAVQYAVSPGAAANSFLNFLMFENAAAYTPDELEKNPKRQVRLAAKQFVIKPVTDPAEFKQQGHRAYLSFYERTRYRYGTKRRDPGYFANWVDTLYRIPRLLILGGYRDGALEGISLSYLVDDTVCYATFFCTTEALKLFLSDLMLHSVRAAAAHHPDARRVFAGMYKGNKGLDGFYLLRGATCVRLPALLRINPAVKAALQLVSPRTMSKLLGAVDDESILAR